MNSDEETTQRKGDHLDIAGSQDVEFASKSTLLEDVELLHRSLPEIDVEDVELGVEAFGKQLDAPLQISGMTGGTERAARINRELASIAQELGIGFGVGSQRAMLQDPSLAETYRVRSVAPDIPLLGNIGATQLLDYQPDTVLRLVEQIDADALCVHLNPAQELIQPEGDRCFENCLAGIDALVSSSPVPIVAKETGCGMSPETLRQLSETGVGWVDVSGAGGTSWTGIESLRAEETQKSVGEIFWNWGIPTAASISAASSSRMKVIGSGGIRNGLEVAKSISLGADLVSMGLPWFRSLFNESRNAALAFGRTTIQALKTACVLTGTGTVYDLQATRKMIGSRLQSWLDTFSNTH